MRRTLLFLAAVPLVAGCVREGGGVVGPCVHTSIGPVLTLEGARLGGRPVRRVEILAAREGGRAVDLAAVAGAPSATGLRIGDRGQVVCTLPCGLGEVPGRWRVRMAGPGGSEGALATYADYRDGGGNCPSYSSDGARVVVTLR